MNIGTELKKSWKKYKGLYLSLAVVTAILPVVLLGVVSNQQLRLYSQASEPESLRIWTEPAALIAKRNQTVTLTIMGEYGSKERIIPEVKASLVGSGLTVSPTEINFKQAFTGRIKLGTVTVSAQQPGNYKIEVAENSVFTSLPDLPVVTGSSQIIIK